MIVKKLNSAFSLTELLTVIAIMATLLAIVVPAYREYTARTKLMEVVNILEKNLDAVKRYYIEHGVTPVDTILNLSNGVYVAETDSDYIDYLYYDNARVSANSTGNVGIITAIISDNVGNSIPGYVAGTAGEHNRISMGMVADGENIRTACGVVTYDATAIPLEYLPPTCQSTYIPGDLSDFLNN